MAGKAILIDGNSLINRAYFAVRPLTNSQGQMTNAVFGFVTMLLKLLREEKPDHLAVAFDKSKITFRHGEYEAYKAGRAGMPDGLVTQLPLIKDVLHAFRIPTYEIEGYEADDILGTIACHAATDGLNVLVLTGDRDALQLVNDRINVLFTVKGISELKRYDAATLEADYGLTPAQIIDLKALMGDKSDNIPGIPGVGEKTALKLLHDYGTVEDTLAHADDVSGDRLRSLLKEHAESARLSRRLATIKCDVPIHVDLHDSIMEDPDYPELLRVFRELEFRGLIDKLGLEEKAGAGAPPPAVLPTLPLEITTVSDLDALTALILELAQGFAIQTVVEGHPVAGKITLISLAPLAHEGKLAINIPCSDATDLFGAPVLPLDAVLAALGPSLADPAVPKIGHNIKPGLIALARWGCSLNGLTHDVALAAYLLDPTRSAYRQADLARELLSVELPDEKDQSADAVATRTAALPGLATALAGRLTDQGLTRVYEEIELPLVDVLARMERQGVAVDRQKLAVLGEEFRVRLTALTDEIYALAGGPFNINSTKQLGEVLFVKLGLPAAKKTKTGYSTDAEVLEGLAADFEIAERILEHRSLSKLKSTYVDGLTALIQPLTGRVHTTFQQTVTATGRLSSTEPNLQNIPIREELGRRLRTVFVPGEPGCVILAADYSQIELRILAHLCGDPYLVDSFLKDQDVHQRTAAEVFGVELDEVTREMRARAKAVNFGIVYGISDFGLARQLKIPRSEAARYIETYFARYGGVKTYMESTIAAAHAEGSVATIFGRRRPLPDINNHNRNLRQFAERTAINTPIQGTAADIIKLAMIEADRQLHVRGLKSRMLLQVHDELIFVVPEAELSELTELVRAAMEGVIKMTVPLLVEVKVGPDWYDVHPIR